MNVIKFPQLVELSYVGLPTFTPSAYILVIGTRLSDESYQLLEKHNIKVKFSSDYQEKMKLNVFNAILLNNLETAKIINKQYKEINLLLMEVNNSSVLAQGLLFGVKGFLSPDTHPEILLNAIFSVSWGDYYIEQKCLESKDSLNLLSSCLTPVRAIERWTYWLASQVFFRLRNRSLACQQPPEILQELGLIPKGENFEGKAPLELDLETSEVGRSWIGDLSRILESVKYQRHLQNPVDFCNSIKNVDGQLLEWSSSTESACLVKIEKKFLNLKKNIGKKFQDYLSVWRKAGAVNCLQMLKLLERQFKHLRISYWQKSRHQQQLEREKRLAFVDELQNLENSSIFQQRIDNWQPSFLVKLKDIYLSKIQSKIYFLVAQIIEDLEETLKKTIEEVAKTEYLLRRLQDKTNMQSSLLVNDFVAITFLERIDFKRTQKQVEEKVGFPLDCWGKEQIKEDVIESYLLEVLTPIAKSIYEEACQAILFS